MCSAGSETNESIITFDKTELRRQAPNSARQARQPPFPSSRELLTSTTKSILYATTLPL